MKNSKVLTVFCCVFLASLAVSANKIIEVPETATITNERDSLINELTDSNYKWSGNANLNIAGYNYKEGLMELSGFKSGVGAEVIYHPYGRGVSFSRWTFDAELMTGKLNYEGQLSDGQNYSYDENSYYYQLKAIPEFKFFSSWGSTQWLGIGYAYRYLRTAGDDLLSYTRDQSYQFIPVTYRVSQYFAGYNSTFTFTFEYDWLLSGKNTTYLSDTDVNMDQDYGYGLGVKFQMEYPVSFEGLSRIYHQFYYHRWSIGESSRGYFTSTEYLVEPANITEQLGLRLGAYF